MDFGWEFGPERGGAVFFPPVVVAEDVALVLEGGAETGLGLLFEEDCKREGGGAALVSSMGFPDFAGVGS